MDKRIYRDKFSLSIYLEKERERESVFYGVSLANK